MTSANGSGAALQFLGRFWSLAFLIGALVTLEIWSQMTLGRTFVFSSYNIQAILVLASIPLILAVGQTFVIVSGGIDLSTGYVMGLASVAAAQVLQFAAIYMPALPALVLACAGAILIGGLAGRINGFIVATLGVPPFIGTLGMFGVARGLAYLFAGGGSTVAARNPILEFLGNGTVLGIRVQILLAVAVVIVAYYMLRHLKFGQYVYAIGANRSAAERVGIDVKRQLALIYTFSGVCAGIAAILYVARFSAGAPQAGEPMLLDSIAMVVIGGASLFGGSGTILGTLIGALIIATIQYGLVVMNVEPFWQFIAVGLIIIAAVLIDQARGRFL
jgi:ribose transport system permease protein